MIYGAILAGGVGKRIEKHSIPKQFITIGGIPIIIRTLRVFVENDKLDEIYIAVHKDWNNYLHDLIKQSFSADERSRMVIVNGGKERLDSFTNIMDAIIERNGLNSEDILICHDSVRPFVQQRMINDCIEATLEDKIALTVVPTTDTIHIAHDERFIDGALDRSKLYNGQTPSGFNIRLLKEAIEQFGPDEKACVTGTTQLMLRLGYKLRIVSGHTSNFKITTDNDLDVADRIVRAQSQNRNISLLDCTLRDGGIVVDFKFEKERIQKIKETLEKSGVDYIECGYIDESSGKSDGYSTIYDSEISIEKSFLSTGKKEKITYVAMIDYGKFDLNKLHNRTERGIDGIRYAFHKENYEDAIRNAKIILSKGYDLYIQPMVTIRYTDEELWELIHACNTELDGMKGFYIVDSFGQLDAMKLNHLFELADQYIARDVIIGFHAHNNRQLAYSNALTFITHYSKHNIMIDSSIMGMGKGAGNLCTELIEEDLIKEGNNYNSTVIYESISEYFADQQKVTPWGYSLDYYLSSLYSCTPSYIKFFVGDERVTTDILVDLIKLIPKEKRVAFDRKYAEEHLNNYFMEM